METAKLGAIVAVALLVGSAVGAGVVTVATSDDITASHAEPKPDTTPTPDSADSNDDPETDPGLPQHVAETGVSQFESADEFREYVRNGANRRDSRRFWFNGWRMGMNATFTTSVSSTLEVRTFDASGKAGSITPQPRNSDTNVQVAGIDEPDLLKTTGNHVYFASQPQFWYESDLIDDDRPTSYRLPGETHVFDSSNPAAPTQIAGINASGNLLLSGDTLVVLQGTRLVGYDVSDPDSPERTWKRTINGTIETARLKNGTIYLVTSSSVSPTTPCPIKPLSGSGSEIACTDIYHPNRQIPADVTYTAYTLEPETGAVTDSVSAVGTHERSAIYTSGNALYLTYTQRTPRGEYMIDAALSNHTDVPEWVASRLREVRSYNLSARATRIEAEATINQWLTGLPKEQRQNRSNAFYDGVRTYVQEHRRELVTTGIVRIGIEDGLEVQATGSVPGEPLNQFSMSEHNGTLRIATTIPRQFGTKSVNDLYTLDAETLQRQGNVTGMGVDQRVYAVRYVGETAYVVTFRQVDPLHVIDLSDPADPTEVGTLKLPGYSSYLHPIDENHVLGIGEEDGHVKTVLFNVSDPSDPTIEDTYYPGSHWSAIAESHHAFLIDRKHGVFFLPGDESGYVVDYTDGDLSLKTEIQTIGQPQRAAYIGDYLYVFSNQELVVMDETDWTEETSVKLANN